MQRESIVHAAEEPRGGCSNVSSSTTSCSTRRACSCGVGARTRRWVQRPAQVGGLGHLAADREMPDSGSSPRCSPTFAAIAVASRRRTATSTSRSTRRSSIATSGCRVAVEAALCYAGEHVRSRTSTSPIVGRPRPCRRAPLLGPRPVARSDDLDPTEGRVGRSEHPPVWSETRFAGRDPRPGGIMTVPATAETQAPPDLERSATRGLAYAGARFRIERGVVFVATLVLARLLTPDEFGVVAFSSRS